MFPGSLLPPFLRREPGNEANIASYPAAKAVQFLVKIKALHWRCFCGILLWHLLIGLFTYLSWFVYVTMVTYQTLLICLVTYIDRYHLCLNGQETIVGIVKLCLRELVTHTSLKVTLAGGAIERPGK